MSTSEFSVREMPHPVPQTKIVEAYGTMKCPCLIDQVTSENVEVRVNALSAICSELKNPETAFGLIDGGLADHLLNYLSLSNEAENVDSQAVVKKSSQALSAMARDVLGRNSLLSSSSLENLAIIFNHENVDVREYGFLISLHLTSSKKGVHRLVDLNFPALIMRKLEEEISPLKVPLLKILRSLSGDEKGLEDGLNNGAVPVLCDLLADSLDDVRKEAAYTLGMLCFSDPAKKEAIELGAVEQLCEIMQDESWEVRAAVCHALMTITTTVEGKKGIEPSGGLPHLVHLLHDNHDLVKLNVLKVIASVSAFPPNRAFFQESDACLMALNSLMDAEDEIIANQARICNDVVNWEP